jgi:hypothetical protein
MLYSLAFTLNTAFTLCRSCGSRFGSLGFGRRLGLCLGAGGCRLGRRFILLFRLFRLFYRLCDRLRSRFCNLKR